MSEMLHGFDSVRIINLVDRADRRREMRAQLSRIDAADDPKVEFFEAHRPVDPGPFPGIGARGCFESHHTVLRDAVASGVERLLIIEDDFDFSPDIERRISAVTAGLARSSWDIFYGAWIIHDDHDAIEADANGIAEIPGRMAVETASFIGFGREALTSLEPFLTAMLGRPAGSPDYGPMHVDGAYSIFRQQHPEFRTLAAWPAIGRQRSSRSDISPSNLFLDRIAFGRPLANWLRRLKD